MIRNFYYSMKGEINNCERCGIEKDKKELIVHHILPVGLEHIFEADLENLIAICKNCHDEVHKIDGCTQKDMKDIKLNNLIC